MDPMKFSEMTYTRPDIDALLADCKALAAKAAAAPDGDALVAVYYEQSRAFADYTTASPAGQYPLHLRHPRRFLEG